VENMKIAVRYYSRTGNTKKLADAIADEIGVQSKLVTDGLEEDTEVLFLGSALYALALDKHMVEFIDSLEGRNIKVYCFSTTALLPSSYGTLKKALNKVGIEPEKKDFHCRGRFGALHSSMPDQKAIKAVRKYAKEIIRGENI
jgi:flavodoxin